MNKPLMCRRALAVLSVALVSSMAALAHAQDAGGGKASAAGVNVSVGPWLVSRSMTMRVNSGTVTHAPNPYLGGALHFSADLYDFKSFDASLLLQGEGGYGAAKNATYAHELQRQPATKASFLAARLTVRRPLSQRLHLDVGLGGRADSYIVEPNRTYTGHRYIGGELRLGLGWTNAARAWTLDGDLSALPVFSINESSGANGAAYGFGVRVGAQIGYNLFSLPTAGGYRGARLMLRYDYTRYRTQFPQQRVVLDGGVSEDNSNALMLMFGYYL